LIEDQTLRSKSHVAPDPLGTEGIHDPRPMSISVVIPAYNAARFLPETLRSVLAQTLPANEILIVDDGSTDNTADIAESFGPPVQVFRRPNARQGASRNFGVSQATGEWIAFLDADDLWDPSKLARQMEELRKHPDADICYTARTKFTQRGDTIQYLGTVPAPPAAEIGDALFQAATFLPSSVVIRRSTFLAMGGFGTTFKITEDWDLWMRLLHSGVRFASCPEPLLLYRIHDNNVSGNGITLLEENTAIFRRFVVPHLSGPKKWIAITRFFSANKADVAYALRERGDKRHLSMMTASILHWPLGDPLRYKVWLHMLLSRIGILRPRPAVKAEEQPR
jgi:glycosyltransferase involved in cell wall biosynthesis